MDTFIQCPRCRRSSVKNEGQDSYGPIIQQTIPPACNVMWRTCADCKENEHGQTGMPDMRSCQGNELVRSLATVAEPETCRGNGQARHCAVRTVCKS